jgi:predicted DNA-binding transcriptional regulator YafY
MLGRGKLSDAGVSIRDVNRTEPRSPGTLPPVALTPEEAAAVAVALAARSDGPYAQAGRGALEKVLAALEPDPRRRAHLLATSLGVSAAADRAAEIRSVVEDAVTRHRVIALRYRDGKGRESRREVEPQLLVRNSQHLFLVAWCREREELRWFREDRIEAVEITAEAAPRRDLAGLGAPPTSGHPAGRALPRRPVAPSAPAGPPRLIVLPGGLS